MLAFLCMQQLFFLFFLILHFYDSVSGSCDLPVYLPALSINWRIRTCKYYSRLLLLIAVYTTCLVDIICTISVSDLVGTIIAKLQWLFSVPFILLISFRSCSEEWGKKIKAVLSFGSCRILHYCIIQVLRK